VGRATATAPAGNGSSGTTGTAFGDVVIQQSQRRFRAAARAAAASAVCRSRTPTAKKVDDVLKAHPKEKKQLEDLRAKMQALRPAGFNGANRNRGDSSGAQRPRGNDSTGQRPGAAALGGAGGGFGGQTDSGGGGGQAAGGGGGRLPWQPRDAGAQ
jgi:hypothetical protein